MTVREMAIIPVAHEDSITHDALTLGGRLATEKAEEFLYVASGIRQTGQCHGFLLGESLLGVFALQSLSGVGTDSKVTQAGVVDEFPMVFGCQPDDESARIFGSLPGGVVLSFHRT